MSRYSQKALEGPPDKDGIPASRGQVNAHTGELLKFMFFTIMRYITWVFVFQALILLGVLWLIFGDYLRGAWGS